VRPLAEVGQLAVAQLVQDLARLGVAEVVPRGRLVRAEGEQCGPGQLRHERDRLVTGDEAVPAEQGHEPGQSGRRQGLVRHALRVEPQGGQVDQAAPVDLAQLGPVSVHFGRG
jgi:hypothetical protein